MNSPVHPETRLQVKEIEPGLKAYECPRSGGVWIPMQAFLDWKERHKESPSITESYQPTLEDDSRQPVLICPESGRMLLRYRVGHGLQFHIDQSPVTGGVWLNKGEWDALKSKGLQTELNLIFTASYQRNVRSSEYNETIEAMFRNRIGTEDFTILKDFKNWVADHPRRDDIWRYLLHSAEPHHKD